MTINEAIYATLDGVNISTDDFPVRKRFVYTNLKNARKELIKQELNKNNLLQANQMQTIESYKFDRELIAGEYLLKGERAIPESIEFNGGQALFLYTMNGRQIDIISKADWDNRKRRRLKLDGTFGYYLVNQIPIIVGFDDIDELFITIEGHFADPELVSIMNTMNDDECQDKCKPIYEYEFICPTLLEGRVIEIAKSRILNKLSIPSDDSNNAKFDPNVESKKEPNG